MEDISDGINFIAIHEFRTSLILFWILNFMGRDECNMHRVVEEKTSSDRATE